MEESPSSEVWEPWEKVRKGLHKGYQCRHNLGAQHVQKEAIRGWKEGTISRPPVCCDSKSLCIGLCSPYRSSHAVIECSGLADWISQTEDLQRTLGGTEPRSNISKEEWKAMKGLQSDKKIKIIQANKGNATVVLDSTEYDKKVKELLGDKTLYSILKDDPTRTTDRKLLNLLRDLQKNKQIPDDVYNVCPSEGSSKPARFYGRLKLHKESKPLRPVVSICGTATYDLAKWLSKTLRPLLGSSGRILKNTTDFVEFIDEVALSGEEILEFWCKISRYQHSSGWSNQHLWRTIERRWHIGKANKNESWNDCETAAILFEVDGICARWGSLQATWWGGNGIASVLSFSRHFHERVGEESFWRTSGTTKNLASVCRWCHLSDQPLIWPFFVVSYL